MDDNDVLNRVTELDARWQARSQNQVDSINRILQSGTYDDEMAALHEQLAAAQVERDQALQQLKQREEPPPPSTHIPHALVKDGKPVTVPVTPEVQRAIDETLNRYSGELDAALEPFGLGAYDIVCPDYERIVRADENRE